MIKINIRRRNRLNKRIIDLNEDFFNSVQQKNSAAQSIPFSRRASKKAKRALKVKAVQNLKRYNSAGNSVYPLPFTYNSKVSARGTAFEDLIISHSNGIVAKDNQRAHRLPCVGDRILTFAPMLNGYISVFCSKVIKYTNDKEKIRVWKRNGGKIWSFNYEVEVLSEIKTYSPDQFNRLIRHRNKILNPIFMPRNPCTRIEEVGEDRDAVWNDVMDTHKIIK